jgi:hypothetical protein
MIISEVKRRNICGLSGIRRIREENFTGLIHIKKNLPGILSERDEKEEAVKSSILL